VQTSGRSDQKSEEQSLSIVTGKEECGKLCGRQMKARCVLRFIMPHAALRLIDICKYNGFDRNGLERRQTR